MRIRRPMMVAALGAIVLLMPGCTLGPISHLTLGQASLGLQGASASVPLTVTCDVGWNVAYGDVTLAQANGARLAQGYGGFENEFPGVPCTGKPTTFHVTVFNSSPWVFRQGDAAVSGDATVYKEDTGELITKTVGPKETRIVRHATQANPSKAAQPTRDPRFARG